KSSSAKSRRCSDAARGAPPPGVGDAMIDAGSEAGCAAGAVRLAFAPDRHAQRFHARPPRLRLPDWLPRGSRRQPRARRRREQVPAVQVDPARRGSPALRLSRVPASVHPTRASRRGRVRGGRVIPADHPRYMKKLISLSLFWLVQASSLLVLFVPFTWGMVALWAVSHFLRAIGLTLTFHRYFA